ncbi:hypothetical protein BS47DRAFT_1400088 [Hydnum rufescens UP504]|uniref:Uncharacterized protein n=1 Tax=Hydnum rufescens UP504 TaxID=1448309 RepID=A0A9P6DP02_9AGAM|nr:hypothetical protein BS47DRAFT_1400088 [Hydnum rufescens UP504]
MGGYLDVSPSLVQCVRILEPCTVHVRSIALQYPSALISHAPSPSIPTSIYTRLDRSTSSYMHGEAWIPDLRLSSGGLDGIHPS